MGISLHCTNSRQFFVSVPPNVSMGVGVGMGVGGRGMK